MKIMLARALMGVFWLCLTLAIFAPSVTAPDAADSAFNRLAFIMVVLMTSFFAGRIRLGAWCCMVMMLLRCRVGDYGMLSTPLDFFVPLTFSTGLAYWAAILVGAIGCALSCPRTGNGVTHGLIELLGFGLVFAGWFMLTSWFITDVQLIVFSRDFLRMFWVAALGSVGEKVSMFLEHCYCRTKSPTTEIVKPPR